jgi:hypothetical protein
MKTIQFFSTVPGVAEAFPIVEAKNYKPEWTKSAIKDLVDKKGKVTNNDTGRFTHLAYCPGIFDLFKTGYIVPMWYDVNIKTETHKDGFSWEVADKHFGTLSDIKFIDTHNEEITNFIPKRKGTINNIIKINTPWNVIVPENLKFLCLPISYPDHFDYESTSGVLDPSHSSEINIQMNWNVENGERLIKAGTPLMHIIPLSEEMFNLEVRTANEKDLQWVNILKYTKTFSFSTTRQLVQKLYKRFFK